MIGRALLESIPLGLPDSLLSVLLKTRYGLEEMSESRVRRLRASLANAVAYEINGFLDANVFHRLCAVLDVGVDVARRAFPNAFGHATLDDHLRNTLLGGDRDSPLWMFINEHRGRHNVAEPENDDEIVDRVLTYRLITAAGRVASPGFACEAKRQQWLLVADEAMKAIAYAIVAGGLELVAVIDGEVLLEVPEEHTESLIQALEDPEGILMAAQWPILRGLSAPASARIIQTWPESPCADRFSEAARI